MLTKLGNFMSNILQIKFPEDFNKRYQEYRQVLLDVLKEKETQLEGRKEELNAESKTGRPYTMVEKGVGYFKFYKEGSNIKIGKETTRQFRLLQCLTEPNFGIQKTTEAIFEAIKQPKDDEDTRLSEMSPQRKTRILEIIEYTKKELQKIADLQGKVKYCYDKSKRNMWLE